MSTGGSDPPQPLGPHVNKRKWTMKKKRPRYVLKITIPSLTPTPITSLSPTNVNIPTQLGGVVPTTTSSLFDVIVNLPSQEKQVLPPVTSSSSLFIASSPSPTVPSTSSVPSPLPEVLPLSTPLPLSGHCRGHECHTQSYIEDGTPCNVALPMISPNGQR